MHCSTIEQPIVGGRSEKQALGEQSSTLVVTSSASFVFALRAKSAVAPLLLLSPANPLALGFAGAPKADSPLYTKGPLYRPLPLPLSVTRTGAGAPKAALVQREVARRQPRRRD